VNTEEDSGLTTVRSSEELTVLVIDDEPKIRRVVKDALRDVVAQVLEAGSGQEGVSIAAAKRPDLIVLDLGLPDLQGIEVCRRLRAWTNTPIVVLSARHSEDEKTALLDAGADDYVTKPFGTPEFRARIRAQLRRARMAPVPGGDAPLTLGDLVIDVARRTVTRDGVTMHLTPTEWALLSTLVTNAGRTLTHRQLFHAVWGSAHGDAQIYLRVYIAHLRRKIEPDAYVPRHIVTEPGVGYRFELQE
jgi:two-component system, OmpR family, KDP operon response regulator KdpE